MNNIEFVGRRDSTLIEHCKARLPVLIAQCEQLCDEIEYAERTMKDKALDDLKHDKSGIYFELQYVSAQRAECVRVLAIGEGMEA